jgi:hypothetical protein
VVVLAASAGWQAWLGPCLVQAVALDAAALHMLHVAACVCALLGGQRARGAGRAEQNGTLHGGYRLDFEQ